jgi:PHS family inorganic phosphate transporter-like MFS transporter
MIIVSAALLPGYLAAFLVIDSWGRKPLQFMGFIMLSILFLIMGVCHHRSVARLIKPFLGFQFQEFTESNEIWKLKVLMFLYCLANFFQNFGPNVTTFVIPAEVFPTRYRATGHGFSAACGKLGAIVAQIIFYVNGGSIQTMYVPFKQHYFIVDLIYTSLSLKIFGFVMLSGALCTLLLPETRGRSLEELSNEHQKGLIRGAFA